MYTLLAHIPNILLIATPVLLLISTKLVSTIMSIAAVFVLLLHPQRRAMLHGIIEARALCILMVLLLFWPLLSVLWSVDRGESLSDWFRVALIMLVGAVLWVNVNRFSPPASSCLIRYMALSSIAVQCFTALETVAEVPTLIWVTELLGGDHYQLVVQYINRFANAMPMLTLALTYGLLAHGMRLLAWQLLIVTILTLLSLDSNSAVLGLTAGSMVWLLMRAAPRFTAHSMCILVPLGFFLLPALTYALLTLPELAGMRETFTNFSAGRMPIWQSLIENSWHHWQLGWGISTTHLIPYNPDLPKQIPFTGPPLHPHHSPLQVTLELGMVGLLLYCAALYMLLKQLTHLPNGLAKQASFALMISYLATGLSSFSIWANWWIGMAWLTAILWRYFTLAR